MRRDNVSQQFLLGLSKPLVIFAFEIAILSILCLGTSNLLRQIINERVLFMIAPASSSCFRYAPKWEVTVVCSVI